MMEAPEVLRLIWAQTWQLTLLIAAVALTVRFTARRRPHLAHALWLVVLIKCVTPPLLSSPGGVFCWLETALRPAAQAAALTGRPADASLGIDFDRHDAALAGPPDLVVWVPTGRGGSEPMGMDAHVFHREETSRSLLAAWLLVVWLTGTAAMLAVAIWRWRRCWNQLCRQRIPHDASYDAALTWLAKRLKVRRPVRLMVTASRFGPAVIGLLRPVIVLPEVIVRGKSPADLEPILAHELLHVRRGDLWIGMLQTVALGLWWFHPLVWFVNRWISREAERCCDEAVLATLRCEPSRYARCLLEVLERKQLLRPVPAFPGVRPVEITSRRLERIMQLRQGCRNRTPWWCWLVMLGLAAATLPGAAWVAAEDQPADVAPPWQPQAVLPQPAPPATPCATAYDARPLGPLVTRQYNLAEALARTREELAFGEREAHERLALEIAAAGGTEWTRLGIDVDMDDDGRLHIQDTDRDANLPEFHWKGASAIVRHDAAGHQRIAERMEQIRRYGYAQLQVDIQFITARSEVVERAVNGWRLAPVAIPEPEAFGAMLTNQAEKDPWADEAEEQTGNRSVSFIEQRGPFQFQVMSADRFQRIEEMLEKDRQTNILSAPKIVTYNGRTAMVQSGCQRPFVVGLDGDEPQIQVITEGVTLRIKPELLPGLPAAQPGREVAPVAHTAELPQAKVAFKFVHSEILDVATRTIQVAGRAEPVTLQVPRVQSSCVESTVLAPLDETLVVGGMQKQDGKGQSQTLLVTMTVRRVAPEGGQTMSGVGVNSDAGVTGQILVDEASFDEIPQPPVYPCVYNVADLVIPVPEPCIVRLFGDDNSRQRAELTDNAVKEPDFDTLSNLIQSTIAPETWEAVGGPGAVQPFRTNLSLVIRQTSEVHEKISELLQQLRRLQDVQVTLETRVLGVSGKVFERVGVDFAGDGRDAPAPETDEFAKRGYRLLTDEETGSLVRAAQDQVQNGLVFAPKVTVFNGQSTTLQLGDQQSPYTLLLQPVASEDRQSVQLRFAAGATDNTGFREDQPPLTIAVGQTLLIDPHDGLKPQTFGLGNDVGVPMLSKVPYVNRLFKNTPEHKIRKMYVLVTPRIIVQEEEEAVSVGGQ